MPVRADEEAADAMVGWELPWRGFGVAAAEEETPEAGRSRLPATWWSSTTGAAEPGLVPSG